MLFENKNILERQMKDASIQKASVTIRPIYKEKIDYYGFLANCLLKFPAEFSAALQSPEK